MLQSVTKCSSEYTDSIADFQISSQLQSCFLSLSESKEGLLETWNNANADLDMVQKGTPENLASNFDIAGVVEFDLEPPDVALVLRVRLS